MTANHFHSYSQSYPRKLRRGAAQVSAAQGLVFVVALVCLAVIFNVYQANSHPLRALPTALPNSSRSQAKLMQNVAIWQASLHKRNITLSCPYLGHDYVARLDLPPRRVVTLDAWDYNSEAMEARNAYINLANARSVARVSNPTGCMVHVFDSTGEEVARANQFGVVTSQFAPIPGS